MPAAVPTVEPLDPTLYRDVVRRRSKKDVGGGDVTTEAIVSPKQRAQGLFLIKSDCVLAGLEIALETFRQLDATVQIEIQKRDGRSADPAKPSRSWWDPRALLVGERTALNFLQRLTGIATLTRRFVDAAKAR